MRCSAFEEAGRSMGQLLGGSKIPARLVWAAWILFVAAWTTALLTPHPTKVAEAVFTNAEHRYHVAKTLHIAAYFVLTVLTTLLPVRGFQSRLLLFFPSLHALATEGLQNFVPTRTGSWLDVGFDHIGIGLGFAVTGIWHWRRASSLRKRIKESVNSEDAHEKVDLKHDRCAS